MLLVKLLMLSLGVSLSVGVRYHDYVIIGAGPAGLQMGYFLEQSGRDYVILERGNVAGVIFVIMVDELSADCQPVRCVI